MALSKLLNSSGSGVKNKWCWYHGALFLAGITIVERGLEALVKKSKAGPSIRKDDGDYYKSLNQPLFAPPAVAFPIAWILNDISTIWGNLRVLNKPEHTPGRREYLLLQGTSWGVYSLFTAMHFGLRSPINALVLTTIHAGLNVASEVVALRELKDKKVALSLVPVLCWLAVALPTAVSTALWNRDSLYKKGPFTAPSPKWSKRA